MDAEFYKDHSSSLGFDGGDGDDDDEEEEELSGDITAIFRVRSSGCPPTLISSRASSNANGFRNLRPHSYPRSTEVNAPSHTTSFNAAVRAVHVKPLNARELKKFCRMTHSTTKSSRQTITEGPSMLTTAQAAARIGVAPNTLRGWRMVHTGPRFHKYSARVFRYAVQDVDAYIAEHRFDPSARASLERLANARQ